MNAARLHTDGVHSDDTPTESMVATHIVAPGPLLPPTPIVLNRRADDTAYMSVETLAAKLAKVGHVSPDLQMTSEEAERLVRQRYGVADEETESMRRFLRARDAYRKELSRGNYAVRWEKVLVIAMIALSLVITAALVWKELA